MSNINLIGGSGFLGKNFSKLLETNNIDYISTNSSEYNLLKEEHLAKFKNLIIKSNSTFIFFSALTPDRGRGIDTFNLNIRMAQNFINLFNEKTADNNHIIYISSDAVYPLSHKNIDDNTYPSPTDLYSSMHLTREIMFKEKFKNLTILRPTLIYGFGDTHNSYGPNRFFNQMMENREINIFGEGLDVRDHLYIDDLCKLLLIFTKKKIYGTYNLATGNSISYKDLSNLFVNNFSELNKINKIPTSNNPTKRYFKIEFLIKELNYKFSDFNDNLKTYYNYIKLN